jgi:ubiquinone/menaquinone biosynthesis C-methylase UbiE
MTNWIEEMAPNLKKAPYGKSAVKFIEAATNLGSEPVHSLLRLLTVYSVYHGKEKIEKSASDPIPLLCDLFDRNTALLKESISAIPNLNLSLSKNEFKTVEQATGEHYGNLFSEFDEQFYFEEPVKLLRDRFERNELPIEEFQGQKALDAGCGGGRYTVALRKIGFGEVVGIDISKPGLENCRARLAQKKINGISYKEGTVLDLPFDDESFDFVFSNGVLHHTRDLVKGIHELLRVLKKGGRGFLYLIESPGGIYWDVIETLRCVMKDVDFEYARAVFRMLGVPPNRRYFILDHIMAPINLRSTCQQIEGWLKEAGASELRRLPRGTDFDRVEQVYQKKPYAELLFGVGDQRYLFKK